MSMVKYALQYADAGLTVFPCNHEPGQWAKRPQIKEWKHNATTNPDQVKRWWTHWPNALIGWALPPHLVVIDTDPRHGGTETELAALCGGTTPDTLKVLSGGPDGSVHYYFIPPHTGLAQREVMPGIDSRIGGKGYVIAPPSPHPDTGTPYTWVNEGTPPAPLPPAIAAILAPYKPLPRVTRSHLQVDGHSGVDGLIRTVLEADDGTRNNKLFWAACRMAENQRDGDPTNWDSLETAALQVGLADSEIHRTIASARHTVTGAR